MGPASLAPTTASHAKMESAALPVTLATSLPQESVLLVTRAVPPAHQPYSSATTARQTSTSLGLVVWTVQDIASPASTSMGAGTVRVATSSAMASAMSAPLHVPPAPHSQSALLVAQICFW